MNKSQRIYANTGATQTSKYIKFQLEQDVDTIEFMTMNIYTKDAYQDFNSDYGVLVGRVTANGGVGIPNAKISIFIPLSDTDAEIGQINSIYPYKTPRDKNAQGKRYNLLPRVSEYDSSSGTYSPKQPFGSFPIKPEIVTNQYFLDVYKKYYKYTALTNSAGDYMIFGVPVGIQTVHMSVDITDIGKYSMSPSSMITAGYPANLFLDGGKLIKPSEDLNDLPNIETQEISVDIIPFWGDSTNFTIGVTQQDFRIRAILQSSFTIFGTSMTMGTDAVIGDPVGNQSSDLAFYDMSTPYENNADIRVYRLAPIDFKIFTFTENVDVNIVDRYLANKTTDQFNLPYDAQTDIRELDKSEYFSYIDDKGNFLLTVPCNRDKVVTDDFGNEIPVSNTSSNGVFTKFYGMALAKYQDNNTLIPITKTFSEEYRKNHPGYTARVSWFKIPQTTQLYQWDGATANPSPPYKNKLNDIWRFKYSTFTGGEVYSVAQFFPTKTAYGEESKYYDGQTNTINYLNGNPQKGNTLATTKTSTAGLLIKVAGTNGVTQVKYDDLNYIGPPPVDNTSIFTYDFAPNASYTAAGGIIHRFFGGQWLNFCLAFPQYTYIVARDGDNNDRYYGQSGIFTLNPSSTNFYFRSDNNQKIIGGYTNTTRMARGDAFRTDFINIPKNTLAKLSQIPLKGINIRRWNVEYPDFPLSAKGFKYLNPNTTTTPTSGVNYGESDPNLPPIAANSGMKGWDEYYPYLNMPTDEPPTAYLFEGIYDNNCVKMLVDFNVI